MSCSKSLSQIFPEVSDSINIKLQSDFVRSLLQAAPSVFVFILSVLFCFIKRVKKHQFKKPYSHKPNAYNLEICDQNYNKYENNRGKKRRTLRG